MYKFNRWVSKLFGYRYFFTHDHVEIRTDIFGRAYELRQVYSPSGMKDVWMIMVERNKKSKKVKSLEAI